MSRILDPQFKYVPAANTDIRKTFARARRQIQEARDQERKLTANVAAMPRRRREGGGQ